jgi:tRNA(Ile)-lysidine synthase
VRDRVLAYIREHELLNAGDRVGVAVSGGADSVSLLRVLLELRTDLGVVLSVLHLNHQIRGEEANEDERFVGSLADQYGLEFHHSSMDVPSYAGEHRLSLETAGREARYHFFKSFIQRQMMDVVATGHTMDDQAETVLMRILRGAGTKGLGGIYPKKKVSSEGEVGLIVRPLLAIRRAEVREYLDSIQQSWREDASNVDLQFTRNRIRHGLLPLIETRFQPSAVAALAQLAEVAREEENYWTKVIKERLPMVLGGAPSDLTIVVPALLAEPVAIQRRLLRVFAASLGITLDFRHIEEVRHLACSQTSNGRCDLPGGWIAVRKHQKLHFECRRIADIQPPLAYEYRLSIPGEIEIKEIGRVIRAFLRPMSARAAGYNPEGSLDRSRIGAELVVRNWRPGDRFWLAQSKAPKKLKEIFQERHVQQEQRHLWPVAVSGGKLVWSRSFGVSAEFRPDLSSKGIFVIEEQVLTQGRNG